MAVLATQQITRAGLTPTYAAAAGGGDQATPDDRTFLHVKNGGGAPITVTITAVPTIDGLALSNLVVTVPNASEKAIGPLTPELFKNPSTGLASVAYSAVTTVTVAAIRH